MDYRLNRIQSDIAGRRARRRIDPQPGRRRTHLDQGALSGDRLARTRNGPADDNRRRDHGRRGRTHEPDPGRARRRADGDRFVARRPSVSGPGIDRSPVSCSSPATPASARPGSWSSCATSPSPRAGRSSPATASTSATARCPTCPSPRSSAGSPSTCPTWSSPVGTQHPALARLQPGRRVMGSEDRRTDDNATLDRGDLFEAVHALLETVAQRAPLLLVIEDTHWADQSTRDMLSFLFSRPFDGPVSIVASYRSDDLHRRHPLRRQVAEWSRIRDVHRVALSPLPEAAVRALIAELVPEGLGRGRARRHRRPRRGQRVLRRGAHQRGRRTGQLGPGRPRRRAPRPRSTGSTTPPARWSARPASRDGGSPTTCSPRPPSLDGAALDEGLRKAVEMNILVAGDGHYSFRHALLGEAVYDDLLPGERVRLHAQYVAALQSGDVLAAPPPSWRGTPGSRWTSTPRSPRASRPATRPARSAAPTRRPTTTSRRSSCSPTRGAAPRSTSTSRSSSSAPPRRSPPAATRSARSRSCRSSSTGCRPTPRPPGGPGCSPPAPR